MLKVAHHGSSYQEGAFLDAVAPAVALVPVGAGNDYGHPNPAVLARLARGGARVLRTDVDGDLAVVRRGAGFGVVVSGARRRRIDPVPGDAELEGWRRALAEDLDRRATRDSTRRELVRRRRWGLRRRHAERLARCAETFRPRDPPAE